MRQGWRHRMAGLSALFTAALACATISACSEHAPTAPQATARLSLARAEPSFAYATIDAPNATATVSQGINAAGHVVGFYATADGRLHGFLLQGGEFSAIDYPGAYFTDARGIGPDDEITGTFAGKTEPAVAYHGYRRTPQGQFQPVHYPGHLYEIPQRVLPDGTILGCRHDNDTMGSMKGVVFAQSGDSEIGAFASMNNGATPDLGRIVGSYVNMAAGNRSEGYVIDHGVWSALLVPGSSGTAAWDVNARGDVVGLFRNGAGIHGFVLTENGFTTVDFPGASATRIFGTNARGDIVGSYVAGGHTHGFLGRRLS